MLHLAETVVSKPLGNLKKSARKLNTEVHNVFRQEFQSLDLVTQILDVYKRQVNASTIPVLHRMDIGYKRPVIVHLLQWVLSKGVHCGR